MPATAVAAKSGSELGKGLDCAGCGEHVMTSRFIPGKGWFCKRCHPIVVDGVSTFPFITRNISGEPIEVQSLRHLRKLEAEHGVNSFVYNYDRPEVMERFEK
jgi:hypothetical protein